MNTKFSKTTPDWVSPGASGVLLREAGLRGRVSLTRVTIDRVLKRDVVMHDRDGHEHRVRQPDLTLRTGGTWDRVTVRLLPPDDPEVEVVAERVRTARAWSKLKASAQDLSGCSDLDEARRLVDNLEAALQTLEQNDAD